MRRFAIRVDAAIGAVFTGWCRALQPDPALPGPAGSAWADAIAAILAALAARFGIGEVPLWQVATAISAARLLLPGWPASAGRGWSNELTPDDLEITAESRIPAAAQQILNDLAHGGTRPMQLGSGRRGGRVVECCGSRLGCGPARSHGTSEVRTARTYQATTAPTTASVDGYITNRL